jgi:hypothetical protein
MIIRAMATTSASGQERPNPVDVRNKLVESIGQIDELMGNGNGKQ